MAIAYWLYGNANYEDSRLQEFQLRLCSAKLEERRDDLIELSRRMMSVEGRKENRTEECWFAGRLRPGDDQFVVALAGEQNTLLGMQYRGSRGLFCMMALAFSGEEKGLYMQEEGLFEPLKAVMRRVNENENFCENLRIKGIGLKDDRLEDAGLKDIGLEEEALRQHCAGYRMQSHGDDETGNFNILTSTPETNERLWRASQRRTVILNVLSRNDAGKLLVMFPDSLVSVIGAANEFYRPQKKLSAVQKRQLAKQMEESSPYAYPPNPDSSGTSGVTEDRIEAVKEKQRQKISGKEDFDDPQDKYADQVWDTWACGEVQEWLKNEYQNNQIIEWIKKTFRSVSAPSKKSEGYWEKAHMKGDWIKNSMELREIFANCMRLGYSAGINDPEGFAAQAVYNVICFLYDEG